MSSQGNLSIDEVALMCHQCGNIHREVTSDVFQALYNIVCAQCGGRGFKLLEFKNLFGDRSKTDGGKDK